MSLLFSVFFFLFVSHGRKEMCGAVSGLKKYLVSTSAVTVSIIKRRRRSLIEWRGDSCWGLGTGEDPQIPQSVQSHFNFTLYILYTIIIWKGGIVCPTFPLEIPETNIKHYIQLCRLSHQIKTTNMELCLKVLGSKVHPPPQTPSIHLRKKIINHNSP